MAQQRSTIKARLLQMDTRLPELLQTREAAKVLGVTTTTVRKHIETGELHALRLGANGNYRIRRDDLEQFLEPEPRP